MSEIGAGIKERLFPSTETKLLRKERNSLWNVLDTWEKYGQRFKRPPENTPVADLYQLAREVGYKVQEVQLGTKYIGVHGNEQQITADNSCRIGKGNILYVAVYKPNSPYDCMDLCHDVGACLTGGKVAKKGCVSYIRVSTFDRVTQFSQGKVFTTKELNERYLLDPKDNTRIPKTYIFDALITGYLKPDVLSSFPLIY